MSAKERTDITNRKTFRSASKYAGSLDSLICRVLHDRNTLQSLHNIKAAANTQGSLAKEDVFIHVHRFLPVSSVFPGMKSFP